MTKQRKPMKKKRKWNNSHCRFGRLPQPVMWPAPVPKPKEVHTL